MSLRRFLLPAIGAVAVLSASCVGFSEPRGWAEPVFRSETAYVFLDKEEFVAIELDEFGGEALWVFPDGDLDSEKEIELEAVYGPPLFAGDRIILAGFSGEMVALGTEGRFVQGRGNWTRDDVKGAIVGGAVLADEMFAFGTTEQLLYVRSVVDGGQVGPWPLGGKKLKGEIWSQPIVTGNHLFVGTMAGNLYAFDLETGEEVWKRPFEAGGAIGELQDIGQGVLFVPTLRGEVWLVDAEVGRSVRGSFKAGGWVWTRPAVEGGIAYFGDFEGNVYALDLGTGRTRWVYEAGDKVKAQPVIIGGTLIVGDEAGVVHFVDLATGNRRNTVKVDGAGKIRANLVEKGGFAWIIGTEGRLFRADPETLTVIEREVRGLP